MWAKQYQEEKMLQITKKLITSKKYVRFKACMIVRIHSEVFCHDTAHSAAGTNSSQKYTYEAFTLNVGSTCSRMQIPHTMSPSSMFSLSLSLSLYLSHPPPNWPGLITLHDKQHFHLVFSWVSDKISTLQTSFWQHYGARFLLAWQKFNLNLFIW
jgi:hypothetical protein